MSITTGSTANTVALRAWLREHRGLDLADYEALQVAEIPRTLTGKKQELPVK